MSATTVEVLLEDHLSSLGHEAVCLDPHLDFVDRMVREHQQVVHNVHYQLLNDVADQDLVFQGVSIAALSSNPGGTEPVGNLRGTFGSIEKWWETGDGLFRVAFDTEWLDPKNTQTIERFIVGAGNKIPFIAKRRKRAVIKSFFDANTISDLVLSEYPDVAEVTPTALPSLRPQVKVGFGAQILRYPTGHGAVHTSIDQTPEAMSSDVVRDVRIMKSTLTQRLAVERVKRTSNMIPEKPDTAGMADDEAVDNILSWKHEWLRRITSKEFKELVEQEASTVDPDYVDRELTQHIHDINLRDISTKLARTRLALSVMQSGKSVRSA